MEIIDSDNKQTPNEYLYKKGSSNNVLLKDASNTKQGLSKFINKFTRSKQQIKKQIESAKQNIKTTQNSITKQNKEIVSSVMSNIKKTISNIALLPLHIVKKTKQIMVKIGITLDQIIHESYGHYTKLTNTKKEQKTYELLKTEKNTPTEKTDAMITYSDKEIAMLKNVIPIIKQIISSHTLSQNTSNTIEFLSEQIEKTICVLETQREITTNNICNIEGFERKNLLEQKPILRYTNTLKNTIKQYKNQSDKVVFHQPITEIKNNLLKNSGITQTLAYQVHINDIWVENLLQQICKHNKQQKTKQHFLLFQIVSCVLAATHLAMYDVIKEKEIETCAHKFIQSIC